MTYNNQKPASHFSSVVPIYKAIYLIYVIYVYMYICILCKVCKKIVCKK